jgi:hypothetical protein
VVAHLPKAAVSGTSSFCRDCNFSGKESLWCYQYFIFDKINQSD